MVSWRLRWTKVHDGERNSQKKVRFSPKVKQQLWILALCRFAEPVALISVFPYLYFMIESFDVPKKDIAFWVGVTSASFAYAQFTSGILWGRASDRFGRKPTILCGLLGTFLSSLLFGFSKSLPMAITSRCMAGLLNGNVGILRTLVAEIVPQKELQPRAFSLMPLVISIFGPAVGGYLSEPVKNHPRYFPPGGFFAKYPYALPNLFNCVLFALGAIIGFLFLEETLESRKNSRDIGLELGQKLTSLFLRKQHHHKTLQERFDENSPLLNQAIGDEEDLLTRQSATKRAKKLQKPPALHEAFTFQSTLNIFVYTFLALHSVAYDQILPVYMSFSGLEIFRGFGMNSAEIGAIFSAFGILAMINQFFRYGAGACLRLCLTMYPIINILSPFAIVVREDYQRFYLYTLIFIKQITGVFAFPCIIIMLTNSAPSLRVLGTLNGVATALAALGRAVGPTIAGSAFSYGQQVQYLLIPFWLLGLLAVVGLIPSFFLVEGKGLDNADENTQETPGASESSMATCSKAASIVGVDDEPVARK
ncbi:major facilitator superfamily domain-containing protein [Kalaharituber pfeilii]|nr:major facilitator superfamily domain-containing protein [Kalaharituber pfeilii]